MSADSEIREIRIEQITVLNPRSRNRRLFMTMVVNIEHIGLKRPITVTPASEGRYDLVCGQGRLEAYQAMGASTIPAIIVQATKEDRYLMSLVENIARRRHRPIELLKEISSLHDRGYSAEQISKKLDLDRPYVYSILHLATHGEERLIDAVERRILPLTVAVEISTANDQEVQQALHEAYESGGLRGQKLINVKRILAQRAKDGKSLTPSRHLGPKKVNAQSILRMYKQTTAEQRAFRARATRAQEHLLMIASGLKQLLSDSHFTELLKGEGLDSLPQRLANRLQQARKAN